MSILTNSRGTTRETKNVRNRESRQQAAVDTIFQTFLRWVDEAESEEELQASARTFKQMIKMQLRNQDELSSQQKFVLRSVSSEVI